MVDDLIVKGRELKRIETCEVTGLEDRIVKIDYFIVYLSFVYRKFHDEQGRTSPSDWRVMVCTEEV